MAVQLFNLSHLYVYSMIFILKNEPLKTTFFIPFPWSQRTVPDCTVQLSHIIFSWEIFSMWRVGLHGFRKFSPLNETWIDAAADRGDSFLINSKIFSRAFTARGPTNRPDQSKWNTVTLNGSIRFNLSWMQTFKIAVFCPPQGRYFQNFAIAPIYVIFRLTIS